MKLLYAYYDLRVAPLSFDFAWFLAIACVKARQQEAALSVTLYHPFFRRNNPIEAGYDLGYQNWRFNNIIVQLCRLCPDVVEVISNRSSQLRFEEPHYPENYHPAQVDISARLTTIPITSNDLDAVIDASADNVFFKSTGYADDWYARRFGGERIIVMNTRQTMHNAGRNTPMPLWQAIYERLRKESYHVVVIPDQDDYLNANASVNAGWEQVPEASLEIDLRLALYRNAHACIAWAGGTNSLLPLCGARFITYGLWNEANPIANKAFWNRKGPRFGCQPHWFDSRHQRYDWFPAEQVTANYILDKTLPWLAGLEPSQTSTTAPAAPD